MAPPSNPDSVLGQLAAAASSGGDLSRGLADLLHHATKAVSSCLGVSMTITRYGLPITVVALTQGRRGEAVRSSLALHLPSPGDSASDTALTIYASATGAFRAMAADLIALLDIDPRRAIVDGHLELPHDTDSDSGDPLRQQLDEASTIDQALGVLLDRGGLLPAQGRLELERLAASRNVSVAAAAQFVLDGVHRGPQAD